MKERSQRRVDVMPTELPPSERIIKEAAEELGLFSLSKEELQENFEKYLLDFFKKTLVVLERYEKDIIPKTKFEELINSKPADFQEALDTLQKQELTVGNLKSTTLKLLANWYEDLRKVFMSVSQSRKTRGGKDFELEIQELFDILEIPYQRKKRKHRVDFMLPSNEFFEHNRNRSLILTAKRTMRERWREVVEELHNTRSPNVYLLTADRDITAGHVEGVCHQNNVHLVVWQDIKREKFPNEPLVIDYTTFLNETVLDFSRFWK